MNDTREIAKLADEASELYQQHGSADTAALLLEKAGNMLLDSSTIDSLRLFQRAGEVALVREVFIYERLSIQKTLPFIIIFSEPR